MRKGTFSVQKASPNSSAHNSRSNPPKYLIGLANGTKNYYELIQSDDDFILEAQSIYKKTIGQKMQKSQVENLIHETVLTLKKSQNENDVKNLFKKLNKKYGGHELLEIAIHRDEGYFERDGIAFYPTKNILKKDNDWYICSDTSIAKPTKNDFDKRVNINEFERVYNYHAHAKFSMFDRKLGKSARMQKKDMSSRIKFVSDELGLLFAPDQETSRIKKSVNLVKDEHLAAARSKESVKGLTHYKDGRSYKELAQLTNKMRLELEKEKKELIQQKEQLQKEIIVLRNQNKALRTLENDLREEILDLREKIVSRANMNDSEENHADKIQRYLESVKNQDLER